MLWIINTYFNFKEGQYNSYKKYFRDENILRLIKNMIKIVEKFLSRRYVKIDKF